jgi:hypothetical protein
VPEAYEIRAMLGPRVDQDQTGDLFMKLVRVVAQRVEKDG